MATRKIRKIRTCVNCRHLEILEEGQVVHGLDDTTYIAFRCGIFNYTGKEVFRFPRLNKRIEIERKEDDCPFWEEWKKTSSSEKEKPGSSDEDSLEPNGY